MALKTNLVAVGIVSAVVGATFLGANVVSAQASGDSLVSKLSERFGLSEDEVQEVFDEHRAERREARQAAVSEHLDGLVEDGTLTPEQRDELEALKDQLREQFEELKDGDLTRDEIREAMSELKEEIETWAEEQGLDLQDLRLENNGHRHGFRGGFGHDHEGVEDNQDQQESEVDDSDES